MQGNKKGTQLKKPATCKQICCITKKGKKKNGYE